MPTQEIISVGFDYQRTEADKVKVLASLKEVQAVIKEINSLQFNGAGLGAFMKNEEELIKIQTKLNQVTAEYTKQQNESTGAAKKQLDAYQQLVKSYKDADQSAKAYAASLGLQSEEYKTADAAAAAYKKQIDDINAARKQSGQPAQATIVSTDNLAELEAEQSAAEKTGVAVSEIEIEQGKAAATATAYGAAQGAVKEQITGTAEEVITTQLAYDKFTGTLQQNLQAQTENNVAIAENKAAQKELSDSYKAGEIDLDTYTTKLSSLKEEYAVIAASNKELAVTINNQVKEFVAAGGSIDELRSQLNNLQSQYEKLSAAERASPFGTELKAEIDVLEPKVKDLEAELGKFQRNVGNYPKNSYNGLKADLKILTDEYNGLTKAQQKSTEGQALKTQITGINTALGEFETKAGSSFTKLYGYLRTAANIIPGIGISGLLLLALDPLISLIEKLPIFSDELEKAAEKADLLAAAQEKLAESAERIRKAEIVDYGNDLRDAEAALVYSKANNENKAKQLDLEIAISKERAFQAQQRFNDSGGADELDKLQKQFEAAQIKYDELQRLEGTTRKNSFGQDVSNATDENGNILSVEEYTKALERSKNELDRTSAAFDRQKEIVQQSGDALKDYNTKQIEQVTYFAEQQRKLILETTTLQVKLTQFANEQVLIDTRSTEAAKLAAIQSTAAAQKSLITAQKNDVLNNPSSSDVDKQVAISKATEATTEVIRNSLRQQFLIQEDYRKRNITADKDSYDIRTKALVEFYNLTADNGQNDLQTRLEAFDKSQQAQKDIINTDYEAQQALLINTNRTQQEIEASTAKYQNDLSQLDKKGLLDRANLQKAFYQQQLADQEENQRIQEERISGTGAADVDISEKHQKAVENLDKSLKKGSINYQQYAQQLDDIDKNYSYQQQQRQIDKDKALLIEKRKAGEDTFELQKKINDEISDLDKQQLAEYESALKEKSDLEKEFLNDIITLGQTIGDASFQKQIDNYEKLKDASNAYYDNEIKNIADAASRGSLTTQQAADQTKILQAEQEAASAEYDRKEKARKQAQARFDKAASIIKILESTAEREVEALTYLSNPITAPLYPEISALIGAIGAAQLAIAFATPIPTYKYGLTGNKGAHFGIYGEDGPEKIEKPGFLPFISDSATLDFLPAGTRITPLSHDEVNESLNRGLMQQNVMILHSQLDEIKNKSAEKEAQRVNAYNTNRIVKELQKNRPYKPTDYNKLAERIAWEAWKRGKINW